jgi:hypothetical protein
MFRLLFTCILLSLAAPNLSAQQKQRVLIYDFEEKPSTSNWWRDNGNVRFSYDERKENQFNQQSKVCLYVRWDSTNSSKPFTWFTDIKADTFVADNMQERWKAFRENTWLSFWCRAGEGDTLMLHYLVLSKGHSSKWGATRMVPATAKEWTFFKVRFADLQYEDWGKIKLPFDLHTETGRCFEIGLRAGTVSSKHFIEAWFDNIQLSNYEPFN